MKSSYIFVLFLAFVLFSCSKDNSQPAIDPNEKGTFKIEFDNVAGTSDLALNTGSYTNSMGETFSVTTLNYYISNIKLKTFEGKEYVHTPDSSYFLIKESDSKSQIISLKNVPAGDYVSATFTIGVDSTKSLSPVAQRTGCLDPTNKEMGAGMYWSWNSGYIFVKLEGISTKAPKNQAGENKFWYHIGGFGGGFGTPAVKTINNIKTKTLTFGTDKAVVRKDKTPQIHVMVDVLKMFNGTTQLSIEKNPNVMFAPFSTSISANYVEMFNFHHLHNN